MWWHNYWLIILFGLLVLPAVSVAIFARWMRRQPNMSIDNSVKCWDIFVKLISAFTVVVSGVMLFGKYIDQQGQLQLQTVAQERKELGLRKAEFLRQKLLFDSERHQRKRAMFDEVKKLAVLIAHMESPDQALQKQFDGLYFADLIGVEKPGGPVETAMIQFRKKFHAAADIPKESLQTLSLRLSTACELELRESETLLLDQHKAIAALLGTDASTGP